MIPLASIWLDLLVLVGLFFPVMIGLGLYAVKVDPTCAAAFEKAKVSLCDARDHTRRALVRWQQRARRNRICRQQQRVLKRIRTYAALTVSEHKSVLLSIWDSSNPALKCAALFNRFVNPSHKAEISQVVADLEAAIRSGSLLFSEDFLTTYSTRFSTVLDQGTNNIIASLCQRSSTAFIQPILRTSDIDAHQHEIKRSVSEAFGSAHKTTEMIKGCIYQLDTHFERFRDLLTPGLFSQLTTLLVGAATGAILGGIGVDSDFIIRQAAGFTAGKWDDWKGKRDETFGNEYCEVLNQVPRLCEAMSSALTTGITQAVEKSCRQRQLQLESRIDALIATSRSGVDLNERT